MCLYDCVLGGEDTNVDLVFVIAAEIVHRLAAEARPATPL